MKHSLLSLAAVIGTATVMASCSTVSDTMAKGKAMVSGKDAAIAADKLAFSGPASVDYAQRLWAALNDANLAGPNTIQTKPYKGAHPHGAVLQNVDTMLTMDGQTAPVLVKYNFGGDGVSIEAVAKDPKKYLGAVTVMYKRAGYDPDNGDWFWAKYLPDGSLDKNPKGMQLAGRVAKGANKGCIACHRAAPGGDMVFTHDRFK